MIEFERHSDCTFCPLFETARNAGIPTRALYDGQEISKDRAILFVGQSPGWQEDGKGKCFIGWTGKLLTRFIESAKLFDYCDIYLGNSCQCKPPQGASESNTQIRICRQYLAEDIAKLQSVYKELIIVALGAKACYSVADLSSLTKAFKKQGMRTELFSKDERECPKVFFTYHPAMLHQARKPALVSIVQSHFELLLRYIKGEFVPNNLKVEPWVGYLVPRDFPDRISVDIETYGILVGNEQTVFNPHKSKWIDGFNYDEQIVTVSVAWRDIEGKLRTAIYKWDAPAHRDIIREWFRKASKYTSVVLGQNIKYDLMYLYMADKELQYWIQPSRLLVDDAMIWGFLYNEQQPEKGLKELSALYGIADYSELNVTGQTGNAKSSDDKELHYYNCLDSAAAYVMVEQLEQKIKDRYGDNSAKLSTICRDVRNMIIWDTFDLELSGSSLDLSRLQVFHDKESKRCKELLSECEEKYSVKIAGKGSDSSLREFMFGCAEKAGLVDDSRLQWTAKTKKIAINTENVNLLTKHLPDCAERTALSLYQEYKGKSKIVNTYTGPLLNKPRQGIVTRSGNIGMVYPTWYAVPSYYERGGGSEEKQGGQIQGRFSVKKPARQTEPRSIRECSISRWPDGKLVEYDVSQDHLRMAALLSGDPSLMNAYLNPGVNIHTQTAEVICPDVKPSDFPTTKDWKKSKEYALGKTLDFLIIFKGGAFAYQRTALHDANIEVDIEFCQQAINRWYMKYHVYKEWQTEVIALATQQGYLELPTGWSRTFGPPGSDISAFEGEILNFLHQTPCAQIWESVHYKVLGQFHRYHLHSIPCLQIHDALFVDIYRGEEKTVDEIMEQAGTNPPLLKVFEDWVGRKIPWAFEKKEYTNR